MHKNYNEHFQPAYYEMDSGYDYKKIYQAIIETYDAIQIIAYRKRGSYAPPAELNHEMHPICSNGYPLVY